MHRGDSLSTTRAHIVTIRRRITIIGGVAIICTWSFSGPITRRGRRQVCGVGHPIADRFRSAARDIM